MNDQCVEGRVKINEIIIIMFSSTAPPNQDKLDPSRAKKQCSTKYGCRKSGTHVRVVSQTLAHGNSNNETRQRNRKRKAGKSEDGKKSSGHEIKESQ